MTSGHTHKRVKVTKGSRLVEFLCKPRWYCHDRAKVNASPYPYGIDLDATEDTYYLSILSILHRWTGLTLEYKR